MSFSEDAKALEASFVTAAGLLRSLLEALQARRAAWVSIRPDTVAPSAEIEQLSHQLAAEERRRGARPPRGRGVPAARVVAWGWVRSRHLRGRPASARRRRGTAP